MRRRTRLADERGFSLLSIIVAIALLTLLFLSLTRGVITVQDAHRYSHHTTVANALAQARLEDLLNRPYANIVGGQDLNPINEAGQPVAQGRFARFWTVQDNTPGPGLKSVEVRVEWVLPQWRPSIDPSSRHVVRLASIVSQEAKAWL